MKPHELEKWSFYWSEARLLVAAVALLLGGVPPILLILPPFSFTATLLNIAWLISGAASLYIAYRWYSAKHDLFGRKETTDSLALFVLVISGINLGLAPILGHNIGMTIWSGRLIFFVVAVLYLWAALYLWKRWNKAGRHLF